MNNIEQIFSNYSSAIYRFCFFRTNKKEDAEDITSKVFMKLIENSDSVVNPRAWLYATTRNELKHYYRDAKLNEEFNEDIEYSFDQSIEASVLDEQTLKVIEQDLREIDPLKSEVILLKLWEDMTFDEIAEITNQSTDSAKKRYYRGISELQLLQKQKEVSRKYSVLPVPILLGGILQLSKVHAYTFSEGVKANILSIITAKAAMKVGFLATTGGKIAAALTAATVIISGGIGVMLLQNQNDAANINNEAEVVIDQQDDSCAKVRYTNDNYPDFSFEYDPCEWEIEIERYANSDSSAGLPGSLLTAYQDIIIISDKNSNSITFKLESIDTVPMISTSYYFCTDYLIPTVNNSIFVSKRISSLDSFDIAADDTLNTYQLIVVDENIVSKEDIEQDAWFAEVVDQECKGEKYRFTTIRSMMSLATKLDKKVNSSGNPIGSNVMSQISVSLKMEQVNSDAISILDSMTWTSEQFAQTQNSCAKVRYTNDNYPDFSFEYDPCEWDVRETLVTDLNSSTEIILENELTKESLIFAIEHVAIFTGYGYTCHDSEYIEVNELIARATLSDEIVFGDKEVYLQYVPIGDPWSNGSRKLNSGNLEVNCSAGEGEFVIRTNIKITEEIRESSIFDNYPNSDQNFNGFLKVYTSSNSIGSTNDFDEIMKTMTWTSEQFTQTQNSCGKVKYTNDNYPDFSFEYDPCEWEIEEKENLISLISQDQILNFRKVVGPSNFAPSTGNFYTCSKLNIENVAGSIYRYKLDPNSDYTYEFDGQNYKIFLEGDDVCGEASPIVRTSIKGSDQILYVSVGLVNNGNKESIKLADEIVKSLTWTP